jgi:hypothetical protein
MYELDEGRIRLAFSASQLNINYSPEFGKADFGAGSFQFTPLIFSAQYNAERWSLTSEYAIRHLEFRNFNNKFLDSLNYTGESYYFQGVYRFTPAWEAFARYDVYYADRDDRSGQKWNATTGAPGHSRFAKDIAAGVRWNVTPQFMLRAEYHRVNGTGWLSTIDNSQFRPGHPAQQQEWDLFSILGSYRF